MTLNLDDTIAAIASAAGAGLRGIIRVSGQESLRIISELFEPSDTDGQSKTRSGRLPFRSEGLLKIPCIGVPVPAAVMTWPTRRSFTGQPMTEIHMIGSPPLLDATLEHVLRCGARAAGRGEFTMRAFLAGRIDLVQAEAVLGVIDATDHHELQTALTQLGGGVTARLRQIRTDLIALLGDLEAGLDFVEEDIEFITQQQIIDRLTDALSTIDQLADESVARLPSGYMRRVVLAGLPNAGKSTLFNYLVGSDNAIVSAIPGTTRDYLTATVQWDGMAIELVDTAGWEAAVDLIMDHAQQLRGEQMQASDLIVWCSRSANSPADQQADQELLKEVRSRGLLVVPIQTQADLMAGKPREPNSVEGPHAIGASAASVLTVSVHTGQGLSDLQPLLLSTLQSSLSSRGELLGSTAARCRDSLRIARTALQSAIEATQFGVGDELISVEIRQCLHALSTILGEVYTDDILDHIFSSFCIGK